MNRERKIIILIVFLLSIYLIKTMLVPYNLELVDERNLYDFDHYQEMGKWFVGIDNLDIERNYQYPPLYPLLISPTTFISDDRLYLLMLDNVFITLTFIPLFLFLNKWLSFNNSIFVSSLLVLFNIGFSPKNIGFPIAVSSFFFTFFIYFFYDVEHKLKHCALFYGLLILTKYLFFFLSPMILLWIYFRVEKPLRLKTTIILFSPAFLFFSLWCFRNILYHGLSLSGALGGYESTFSPETFLNIPTDLVAVKLASIFTEFLPNTVINYFTIFIFGFVLVSYLYHKKNRKFMKIFDLKLYQFYIVLMLNLLIFFFILGFTYRDTVLHWRYLTYLILIYVSLGILPFLRIIEYKKSRYKTK